MLLANDAMAPVKETTNRSVREKNSSNNSGSFASTNDSKDMKAYRRRIGANIFPVTNRNTYSSF
jgi:hypothetical protein